MTLSLLNGQWVDPSKPQINLFDRGFMFGDGAYEVVRVYHGKPFYLDAHLKRFARSLRELQIKDVDFDRLEKRVLHVLEKSGLEEATVYFQVTRGTVSVRTHAFPAAIVRSAGAEANPFEDAFPTQPVEPTEFIYVASASKKPELRTGARAITHRDLRWRRCDIKSINLLGNIFAAQAAKEANVYDAILIDERGYITEGSHTNVFAVFDGVLHTAAADERILLGITRAVVLDLARTLNISIVEKAFHLDDLARASEILLTGTTTEIMPVVSLDEKPVGHGIVGATARTLQVAYENLISRT